MKDINTNLDTDTAGLGSEGADTFIGADFDPARVFADPVSYLEAHGLRSELLETQHLGFPVAA
jgi:hypothetical protein